MDANKHKYARVNTSDSFTFVLGLFLSIYLRSSAVYNELFDLFLKPQKHSDFVGATRRGVRRAPTL